MKSRIRAAQKCQDAGYPVRFRFSPIIPIEGWREENEKMIRQLLSGVRPDIICIQTLTHMSAEQIRRSMDTTHFDDEILSTMEEDAKGDMCGPFPHETREMIYRFFLDTIRSYAPEVPIVTCLETPEMWKALGDELKMTPENYVCCCGPNSVPENPLFSAPSDVLAK